MKGWRTVPLSEVAVPSGKAAGDETQLPVFSVTKHRGFVASLEYFKKQVFSRELDAYTVVEPGEFAYATIHLDEGSIGICPEKCLISPMYTAFRIIGDAVHPPFILRYLKSPRALAEYPRLGRGSVERRRAISFERLGQLQIPLPGLPEQRRIAEVLDCLDALRAKRRAALAQLDTLTQAIFLDMFGDPARNPRGWPQNRLGELISVGPQNGLYKPASDYGSGTPILRIDAFYDGIVTKLSSLKRVRISAQEQALYALREGEIVINRVNSREYLGKSALIPALSEATVFESNMMRFDVDRKILDPGYLIQYLQTSFVRIHILRSAKDAVNQSSINQQDVKALPIIVPPLSMQQVFTQRLAARDRLKAAHDASLAGLEALFASLQHRAFRGEL